MKKIAYLCAIGSALVLLGCDRESANSGGTSDSQTTSAASSSSVPSRQQADTSAPDNTGKNVRDRSDATITPGDQGENQADLELTRKVRREITSNDQLSSNAKNIKIITKDGKVTLRGPVDSEQERKTIESLAQKVANGAVDDQLEIKSKNQ